MGSGQVGLLWKALSEDKSTRGLAYAGPSTWCRPHFSVRIPEPAGTLLCHPWQSCSVCHFWQPLLCIEFWTPQEPQDWVGAWVQGMSACRHLASHPPGPAQTLNRISARVKQCGPRTISKQQGHQHKPPEQAVGMAMYLPTAPALGENDPKWCEYWVDPHCRNSRVLRSPATHTLKETSTSSLHCS